MNFVTPKESEGIRNQKIANAIKAQLAREKPLKGFRQIIEDAGGTMNDLDPIKPEIKKPSHWTDNLPEYDKNGRKIYPWWKVIHWITA